MTETRQFIEDAIKAGHVYAGRIQAQFIMEARNVNIEKLLLDPLAWQAVGKTRGWKDADAWYDWSTMWEHQWHKFIVHLADGKSTEDALLAIK